VGKLSNLKPRFTAAAPRLARRTDAEGHSPVSEPWRAWYHLSRWKHPQRGLRIRVLRRDLFTCQWPGCGRIEADTSLLVADHKIPHRGDPDLFWDEEGIWTLCKPHHDGLKQASEKAGFGFAGVSAGPASPGRMSRPDWFRKVHVPLTIVCGPPGSGKSTYVRQHAGPDDLVVCFDEISTQMFGRSGALRAHANLTAGQVADVLRQRNERLGDLMRPAAAGRWPAAWLILTEPKAEHRTWWAETLGARVIVLAIPADVCRHRVQRDAEAGDIRGDAAVQTISSWWDTYRIAPCDETIVPT